VYPASIVKKYYNKVYSLVYPVIVQGSRKKIAQTTKQPKTMNNTELKILVERFKAYCLEKKEILQSVPDEKYHHSVVLDRMIMEEEKTLEGDEQLTYTRNQAYFKAKIPQYFLNK